MSRIFLGQACTKQLSVIYLKFTFNQASYTFPGSPLCGPSVKRKHPEKEADQREGHSPAATAGPKRSVK